MLSRPNECAGCPLNSMSTGFSHSDGTCKNGVLILGEALGKIESEKGVPFVGDAGAQLRRTFGRMGVERDDFLLYNAVNCRPPNNYLEGAPWEQGAVDHCDIHFQQLLKQHPEVKVIVPTGNIPMNKLLGFKGILDRRAPRRGYVYDWNGIKVVPTLHPSFIMQGNQQFTGVMIYDINRALEIASTGWVEHPTRYIQYPTTADVRRFVGDARLALGGDVWLTADIETAYSHTKDEEELDEVADSEIRCISFAYKEGEAITIPWRQEFIPMVQELFLLASPFMVFWNQAFDVPRLKSKGITIGPRLLDGMWLFHFLQSDVPKGLGFVSTFFTRLREWKSTSDEQPERYSCTDSDAAITNTYRIRDQLRKERRFDRFVEHCVELDPVLEKMSENGIKVDLKKREDFRKAVDDELRIIDGEIQLAVPSTVRSFKPRRKIPNEAVLGGLGGPAGVGGVWDYDRDTGEWGLRYPFLYNSSKQVVKYLQSRGYKVPKNYKTGKDSTDKDELERLWKRYPTDPVLRKVVEAREHKKLIGQYVDGYEPGKDGRIHTTYTHGPATWRLASQSPNMQNVIQRAELAKRYRGMFVAGPGNILVECDYTAEEPTVVGVLAKDPEYVRAARLGVHAIFASYLLGKQNGFQPIDMKWSDADIKEAVKEVKDKHETAYQQAKNTVNGSNYGGTPKKFMMDFPEFFPTMKFAEFAQDLYFSTIGKKLRAWQDDTIERAFRFCYLESPFQYRRYFWDVLRFERAKDGWKKKWSTQAKDALAFVPQNTGFGIIADAMLRLAKQKFYRDRMLLQIHDALVFELPKDRLLEERVQLIKTEMERPIKELGGLVINVKCTTGLDWGSMKNGD
jgi:uracil-DNA glycosylase family 4